MARSRWFHPFLVCCLNFYMVSTYLTQVVWTPNGPSTSVFLFFLFCQVLAWVSIIRAHVTCPGYVPKAEPWLSELSSLIPDPMEIRFLRILGDPTTAITDDVASFVKSMPLVERKLSNARLRFCGACQLFKPDRAHVRALCV